jgi:phosphoribosylanthranilate isomerase
LFAKAEQLGPGFRRDDAISMTAVKICGLSTPDTLDAAIAAGADHVGFVFFAKSPRNLDVARVAALADRVPAGISKVGVLVDPDDALLAAVRLSLDIVQVHASTPERVAAIAARFGLPVWAAVGVATSDDIAAARRFAGAASALLFDAKTPKGADLPGGMGLRFDWRLLGAAKAVGLPWGLAGGLDPGNVAEAIQVSGAPLVDVSSGVEESAGVKSVAKIRAFLAAAKAA